MTSSPSSPTFSSKNSTETQEKTAETPEKLEIQTFSDAKRLNGISLIDSAYFYNVGASKSTSDLPGTQFEAVRRRQSSRTMSMNLELDLQELNMDVVEEETYALPEFRPKSAQGRELIIDTQTSFISTIDSARFHTGGSQTLPRKKVTPVDVSTVSISSEPLISPAPLSTDSFPPIMSQPNSAPLKSPDSAGLKSPDSTDSTGRNRLGLAVNVALDKQEKPWDRSLDRSSIASPDSIDVVDTQNRRRMDSTTVLNVSFDIRSFRRWITCLCDVNFDLELGQALELIYPPTLLTEVERKNISFSAFPDSNSSSHLGDTVFSFRIRSAGALAKLPVFAGRGSLSRPTSESIIRNSSSPNITSSPMYMDPISFLSPLSSGKEGGEDEEGCRFGFVFFRQERDERLRRGFFQKSLVLLTPHPFHGLFSHVVKSIGSKYFDVVNASRRRGDSEQVTMQLSREILDSVCREISNWPSPPNAWNFVNVNLGTWQSVPMEYPFMEQILHVGFPIQPNQPLFQGVPTSTIPHPLPPLRPCRLYDLMHTHLEMLWILYELVLLCEPILVQGDSPRSCGETVWSMVEMIRPLSYAGEWRPYFTVQDPEFRLLRQKSMKEVGMRGEGFGWRGGILGVTNPVFTKVLGPRWGQNVIVVKRIQVVKRSETNPVALGGGRIIANSVEGRRQQEALAMASISKPSIFNFFNFGPVEKESFVGPGHGFAPQNTGDGKKVSTTFLEVCQGITTKHKPFFRKDRKLLTKVAEASMRGGNFIVLNNILRRYFAELTTEFMTPLERYFDGLVTKVDKVTLFNLGKEPEIRPFGMESFLKDILENPPVLSTRIKRPIHELYSTFLKTPNFAKWIQDKTEEINLEHRMKYLKCLTEDDVEEWILARKPQEVDVSVEIVDLLLRFQEEYDKWVPLYGNKDGKDGKGMEGLGQAIPMTSSFTSQTLLPPTKSQWSKLKIQQVKLSKFLPFDLSSSINLT